MCYCRGVWVPVLALLALGGCAQIFGLEETTARPAPDAARVDARVFDAPLPCAGGDARSVDPVTGACYVLFTGPMPRDLARTTCQGLGGTTRLASIQSASENALIKSLAGDRDVFLGGSDALVEMTFVWDDGTSFQYLNWNTGEPNNGAGMFEEDCLVMIGVITTGVWNDVPCAPAAGTTLGSFAFVCERD
jgi:hypothetical protein